MKVYPTSTIFVDYFPVVVILHKYEMNAACVDKDQNIWILNTKVILYISYQHYCVHSFTYIEYIWSVATSHESSEWVGCFNLYITYIKFPEFLTTFFKREKHAICSQLHQLRIVQDKTCKSSLLLEHYDICLLQNSVYDPGTFGGR